MTFYIHIAAIKTAFGKSSSLLHLMHLQSNKCCSSMKHVTYQIPYVDKINILHISLY